ncbi:GNAT family N-acetyltransferase [bacterium]|nr:GNAT family N-acetyltransferase [bacterium]
MTPPLFVVEDENHAELCGEFDTFESAIAELRSRAAIPWNEEPNRCPCQSWETCGRTYAVLEYDTSKTPWTELSRRIVLEISQQGLSWHEPHTKDYELSFREVVSADLPQILELYHHLHESEPVLTENAKIAAIWNQILHDSRLHCFVAVLGTTIVGSCTLDIIPNLTRGARSFGVLQNVVTDQHYRGRGIGRQLNQHALDFAWSQNCYQVLVQTGRPEAITFYEKLGFRRDKIGLAAKPEWG